MLDHIVYLVECWFRWFGIIRLCKQLVGKCLYLCEQLGVDECTSLLLWWRLLLLRLLYHMELCGESLDLRQQAAVDQTRLWALGLRLQQL